MKFTSCNWARGQDGKIVKGIKFTGANFCSHSCNGKSAVGLMVRIVYPTLCAHKNFCLKIWKNQQFRKIGSQLNSAKLRTKWQENPSTVFFFKNRRRHAHYSLSKSKVPIMLTHFRGPPHSSLVWINKGLGI